MSEMRLRTHKPKGRGFTLLEVMVAVVIVFIVAGIVVPNYERIYNKIEVTPQLENLMRAIKKLHAQTGQWPHGEVGCAGSENICTAAGWKSGGAGLIMDDPVNPYPFWNGPYLEPGSNVDRYFLDPWGNAIFYDGNPDTEAVAGHSSIASGGPDGVIDSWNRPDLTPQGDDIIIYQQ